jgi:hypothetical protein
MSNLLHCCQHVVPTPFEGSKAAGAESGEGMERMRQGRQHKLGFSYAPLDPPVQERDRMHAN